MVKKRKQSSPIKRAKNKAWKYFSIYIRTRDNIRFSGDPDMGMCVTCKKEFPFKELQAGHFVGGRTNALLFDEEIVYTQCANCNLYLRGNYQSYTLFMLKEVGEEKIEEFLARKSLTLKYTTEDFLEIADKYKEKARELRQSSLHSPLAGLGTF
jgi:hypothetical protein